MNLLDKLVLALRSAVNDVVSDDVVPVTKEEQALRTIDKAQARLDGLNDDLARAEKRGQDELAERLRTEIADLQTTLDKTRKRLNQVQGRKTASPVEPVHEAKPTQHKTMEPGQQVSNERGDQAATGDELDGTRIADMLSKKKDS